MANPEHVNLLKCAIWKWREWRQEHPEIQPDLSNTDLSRMDLISADLSYAHVSGTNLRYADLGGANLSGADLSGTSLFFANLAGTNLSNANLSRADLTGAHFILTDLSNTDFSGVHLSSTSFSEMDLSSVKGLETAIHNRRSILDINSVILPRDEYTRLHFLRGIGFTETQIDYLPSLMTPQPIQYQSLFISNAHQDEPIAQQLYTSLRKKDVPCWFAKHDLRPGNYSRQGIDQAIHTQERVLLLLSEHSVQSGWVRYEVELALSRENDQQREILYPIRLDEAIFDCTASWARSLRATRHIGDFTSWQDDAAYQQAFSTLLRHLKITQPSANSDASSCTLLTDPQA